MKYFRIFFYNFQNSNMSMSFRRFSHDSSDDAEYDDQLHDGQIVDAINGNASNTHDSQLAADEVMINNYEDLPLPCNWGQDPRFSPWMVWHNFQEKK